MTHYRAQLLRAGAVSVWVGILVAAVSVLVVRPILGQTGAPVTSIGGVLEAHVWEIALGLGSAAVAFFLLRQRQAEHERRFREFRDETRKTFERMVPREVWQETHKNLVERLEEVRDVVRDELRERVRDREERAR